MVGHDYGQKMTMHPNMPPVDPNESFEWMPTGGRQLAAPTAFFLAPAAAADADTRRAAGRVLDLRPGVLFVVKPD
jgi:hypothetical protein